MTAGYFLIALGVTLIVMVLSYRVGRLVGFSARDHIARLELERARREARALAFAEFDEMLTEARLEKSRAAGE